MASNQSKKDGARTAISGAWKKYLPFAVPAAIGFGAALVFSGGFASFLHFSNTMEFCISCHEMESTVYQEYKESTHFSSRSGVTPICSDCHVPHGNWLKTIIYKTGASKELIAHFITHTVNTPEKFEAKRLELAQNVWAEFKANDSAQCRSCHKVTNWDLSLHKARARGQHESMAETGETCIDCHKGIAHKDVQDRLPQEEDSFSLEGEEDGGFELQ